MTANRLDTIRALLDQLGISPEELLDDVPSPRGMHMPTIAEYVDLVAGAVSPGAHRVYGTYWRRVSEMWGHRRLDEPTPTEIQELAEQIKSEAVVRRNSRGGRTAAEHLIGALRCLYRHAVADGLIRAERNPATAVAKPRRLASTRRALPDARLAEINDVAGSTGNDPDLDMLLLRLHTETACRRGGALALRQSDLDVEQCLIQLREKGETMRWQPVSPGGFASTAPSGVVRPTARCSATGRDAPSRLGATTTCGGGWGRTLRGCGPSRCPRIGCGTRP